jgi:hypothetical protein
MIYQHRIVISRAGKLEKRHEMFQATTMQALDDAGSALLGAWEVYIGDEAASAVWRDGRSFKIKCGKTRSFLKRGRPSSIRIWMK